MVKTVSRSKEAQRYASDVRYLILHQGIKSISSTRLSLYLYVYPPDKKRRDIDNLCKAILDGLQNAGVFADDFHIQQLYIERRNVRPFGEVEFILRDLNHVD